MKLVMSVKILELLDTIGKFLKIMTHILGIQLIFTGDFLQLPPMVTKV